MVKRSDEHQRVVPLRNTHILAPTWAIPVTVNAVVALAGMVVLLWYALGVVRSTHDLTVGGARTRGEADEQLFACIEDTVEQLLPAGTRVAVHPGQGDDLWPLRLTEFAFPRYEVVTPRAASHFLAVGTPPYAACDGWTAGAFPRP